MYYGVADEQSIGYIPLEVKKKYKAELKAQEELKGATSDDSSDNNDDDKDKGGNDIDARVDLRKLVAVLDQPQRLQRPRQADWLLTPPLESPLAILYRRKQRRISRKDKEEKGRPIKKHVSFI